MSLKNVNEKQTKLKHYLKGNVAACVLSLPHRPFFHARFNQFRNVTPFVFETQAKHFHLISFRFPQVSHLVAPGTFLKKDASAPLTQRFLQLITIYLS